MTLDHASPEGRPKARTEDQKRRRRELWLAGADDRRRLEEHALQARYAELKAAMARLGVRIGAIADLAERHEDPVKRFQVLKARVERWEALWAVTVRKRITRGKIIVGGALLAELNELVMEDPNDQAFLARVIGLLDRRVPRVQDRLVIRDLVTPPGGGAGLTLRSGGPPDETAEQALAALGQTLPGLGRGRPDDPDDEDEDEENGFEPTPGTDGREGRAE